MLGDSRLAHLQEPDEITDRALVVPQEVEDAPAIGLHEHLEHRHEPFIPH
jgi:hypothetical protein